MSSFLYNEGEVLTMKYINELNLLKTHVPRIYKEIDNSLKEVSFKSGDEIVTTTDLYIESELIRAIKHVFPKDTFLSEEFHKDGHLVNRAWLIDPIDGTSNYAVNFDAYVVQIALYDEDDLALAFIYVPSNEKIYYAIKGEGAYLNDKRIHVLDNKKPSNKMMSMVGYTNKNSDKTYYEKLLKFALKNQVKLRMLGSIGLELAITSEGIFTMFYTSVKNLWDLGPGVLLCKEAGALLFNETGAPYQLGDTHLFVVKSENYKQDILKSIEK